MTNYEIIMFINKRYKEELNEETVQIFWEFTIMWLQLIWET